MPKMIHSKYGYEPPEYVRADAELEKWLKNKKECESEKCGSKMKHMKAKTSTKNSLKA